LSDGWLGRDAEIDLKNGGGKKMKERSQREREETGKRAGYWITNKCTALVYASQGIGGVAKKLIC